jgi:hypothetical protein
MADLYTKDGRPLRRSGDNLFSRSGVHVAKIRGNKAYGPDGQYVGTMSGNRLIYRSTDSVGVGSPFAATNQARFASADSAGTADWGDEPPIPD